MAENKDIHCNVLTCRRALCHETEVKHIYIL